jgi:hypothetical protein
MLCAYPVFAEETAEAPPPAAESEPAPTQEGTPPKAKPAGEEDIQKAMEQAALMKKREPFKIQREFEAQQEEVEPPEIKVTGIMRAHGKTVAMAEMQFEKVEGSVLLRPGMRVSIPKPERENSESDRWMTYFTVQSITAEGMIIVLENGETVWYPVMGDID